MSTVKAWVFGLVIACLYSSVAAQQPLLDSKTVEVGPNETVTIDWPMRDVNDAKLLNLKVRPKKGKFVAGSAKVDPRESWRDVQNAETIAEFTRHSPKFEAGKHYTWTFSGVFKTEGDGSGEQPKWTVIGNVETCKVEITTKRSNFELAQAEPDKQSLDISAQITPSDHIINWKIEGAGAKFVEFTYDETSGTSKITVSLKQPTPQEWVADSKITVTAFDKANPTCKDSVDVALIKFKREDGVTGKMLTAPGADPVTVTLKQGNGRIGYSMGFLQATATARVQATIDSDHKTDDDKEDLKFNYKSDQDRGNGKFALRETLKFEGNIDIFGAYLGFFHNASIGLAGAVSAGVDNDAVPIANDEKGISYNGYPASISIGIDGLGNKDNVGVGVSVTLTVVTQDKVSANAKPKGEYIVEASETHIARQPLTPLGGITKRVRVAVGGYVEQTNDDEWNLNSINFLHGALDTSNGQPKIGFSPDS